MKLTKAEARLLQDYHKKKILEACTAMDNAITFNSCIQRTRIQEGIKRATIHARKFEYWSKRG